MLKVTIDHDFSEEEENDKYSRATYATYITYKVVVEYYICFFDSIDFNDDGVTLLPRW